MAPKEFNEVIVQILLEGSPSNASVKKWAVEFKQGRDSTEDDLWSGNPNMSTTVGQVDAFHGMVLDDKCLVDSLVYQH